jgi:GNAT superfamily N-acetyltransferase
MSATSFRLASEADAEALARFMTRNFLAAYGDCSTPENVAATVAKHYGVDAQRRQLGDPARINLLAEIDGRLVGHSQLHVGGDTPPEVAPLPSVEVARFYVDVDFHGRGIAQEMMAQSRQLAAQRGATSLWLSCWQEQPQAVRFYEKEGFRIAGTLVFVVGDHPTADWLLDSPLDPPAPAPPPPPA